MSVNIIAQNGQNKVHFAQKYLLRGWQPIPIPKGSKAPTIPNWTKLHLTLEDLPQYFYDGQNIGILLGEPSGWLVDVDLDDKEALRAAEYFLPKTGAIFGRKSKPKSHYLYVSPHAKTLRFEFAETIAEIRSTGTQTIFPDSMHPSGENVEWYEDGEPTQIDFTTLRRCVAKLASCVLLARNYPPQGMRQFASMALAGWLLRNDWSREEVAQFLEALCVLANDEEFRQRIAQIRNTAQKIEQDLPTTGFPRLCEYYDKEVLTKVAEWLELRKEYTPPTALILDKFYPRPFTEILIARYQFWWPGGKEPLFWFDPQQGLWRSDGEDLIAHQLRTAIENLSDMQKKRYVIEEIISDVKELSWKGKPLPEPPLHLVPLQNGVFDLEVGQLREFSPKDYFTSKLPWSYNPEAKSELIVPLVESFLPKQQTITLYELMAYCLWRSYPLQKFFLLFGRGANGKSLFARILENLLGKENVAHVSLTELQFSKFAGAQLYRKLANIAGELEYREIQKTQLLKQLTGDDTIEADRKYRDPIKFRNYAKIIFLTNEVPRSVDTSEAFIRRIFLIEFPKRFEENPKLEIQVSLAQKEEYEALLFIVLKVLQDLRSRGFVFTHHPRIEETKELYEKLSSPLRAFIEEYCEITYKNDDYIPKTEFQTEFERWLQERGRTIYSPRRLKKEMEELGISEIKKGDSHKEGVRLRVWGGIKWKSTSNMSGMSDYFQTIFYSTEKLFLRSRTSRTSRTQEYTLDVAPPFEREPGADEWEDEFLTNTWDLVKHDTCEICNRPVSIYTDGNKQYVNEANNPCILHRCNVKAQSFEEAKLQFDIDK